jgi:hypothetical protein
MLKMITIVEYSKITKWRMRMKHKKNNWKDLFNNIINSGETPIKNNCANYFFASSFFF